MVKFRDKWLLLFYKLFHAFAQYLIYISLNLTVPVQTIGAKTHKKGQKTILETLQVFLALATYLKTPKVARQLHTHCLNITTNYKRLNLYNNTVPFSPLTPQ